MLSNVIEKANNKNDAICTINVKHHNSKLDKIIPIHLALITISCEWFQWREFSAQKLLFYHHQGNKPAAFGRIIRFRSIYLYVYAISDVV